MKNRVFTTILLILLLMGVHEATIRLKNGQKIRVDGTTGKILILEQN